MFLRECVSILMCILISLCSFRCRGEHGGQDEAAGVCPEQEEGPRPAEPQPGRPAQRRSVLVPVRNSSLMSSLGVMALIRLIKTPVNNSGRL